MPIKNGLNTEKLTLIERRYSSFGKYIINHYQLNNNKLIIKCKTLSPVPQLKQTVISDDLKRLLIDLLDTSELNIDLQKKIEIKEVELLELLLKLSGLQSKLQYKRYKRSIDDYVNRFEVLRGGLLAGNESPELKAELIDIIKLLNNKNINKISDEDAKDLIAILS